MCTKIQREVGGRLANAKTENLHPPGVRPATTAYIDRCRDSSEHCNRPCGAENGTISRLRGPRRPAREPFVSIAKQKPSGTNIGRPRRSGAFRQRACKPDPVVSGHLSRRGRNPGGAPRRPATYLDLAEPGRRSCLALHRAGFAWPSCHHDAGALLPHPFTFACTRLTCGRAIGRMFLWHFPAAFAGWPLATALPFGVRTFLEADFSPPRVRLARSTDVRERSAARKPGRPPRLKPCGKPPRPCPERGPRS
jgi:hypothetical protein